jgi:phage replication-related protein YjqB (UPF0714/DUF867 family)
MADEDKYACFADLAAANTAGIDYQITVVEAAAQRCLVMAIHGGGIEPGTTELAQSLAGDSEPDSPSLYLFEGLRSSGNSELHLTSTHFDEPQALAVVARHEFCVSIHGCAGQTPVTYIGGRDVWLRETIARELDAAGFAVLRPGEKGFAENLAGTAEMNIWNRTTRGKGVQLELTRAQRAAFFAELGTARDRMQPTDELDRYIEALRRALNRECPAGV